MKKQNFEKIIASLLLQIERESDFAKQLEKFFDGHLLSEISTGLQSAILDALEDELNDPERESKYGSLLRWWLFDAPKAGQNESSAWLITNDGVHVKLRTAGELYDYFMGIKHPMKGM